MGVTPSVVALLILAAVVEMSAIAEISGTSIMTEPSIIVGFLVVVIPATMVVVLMTMPMMVRVSCGVIYWGSKGAQHDIGFPYCNTSCQRYTPCCNVTGFLPMVVALLWVVRVVERG